MNDKTMISEIPKGRNAFIIIHGIGEQKPFDTMDYFGRNWIKFFEKSNINVKLEHMLVEHEKRSPSHITDCVRISPCDASKNWQVDVYEYHWAYQTNNEISISEVLKWLERTLMGTINFYSQPQNQRLTAKISGEQRRKKIFKYHLRIITIFIRAFKPIYPLLRLVIWLILSLSSPFLSGRFLQCSWKLSKQLLLPALVNHIGDIAVYSTTDTNSAQHKVRQRIIKGCLKLLKSIIQDKQASYDKVVLVGHSLGSCIAYDTLNLLNIEINLPSTQYQDLPVNKIVGLVTFGSPLDKVAFFHQESQKSDKQYIRTAIIQHLTSFRINPQIISKTRYLTDNPIKNKLEKLRWVNYYHHNDPIGGRLDYYQNLYNVLMKYKAPWGNKAHQGYWVDFSFYEHIARCFLYSSREDEYSYISKQT